MDAFIYTRTFPNDRAVGVHERHVAQERRCLEYIKRQRLKWVSTFSDQGRPRYYHTLPSMTDMLDAIKMMDRRVVIICDNPVRLSEEQHIRKKLIRTIEDNGGRFVALNPINNSEGVVTQIMQTL